MTPTVRRTIAIVVVCGAAGIYGAVCTVRYAVAGQVANATTTGLVAGLFVAQAVVAAARTRRRRHDRVA